MAEIITIPDLENGKVDIDTLADIVNLQEPTTETRLSGPVNTWFGVQSQLTSATGLAYTSKTAMDAAPGTKVGQAARVTEGADNGLYLWDGSDWVKTTDPLGGIDVMRTDIDVNTENLLFKADKVSVDEDLGGVGDLNKNASWLQFRKSDGGPPDFVIQMLRERLGTGGAPGINYRVHPSDGGIVRSEADLVSWATWGSSSSAYMAPLANTIITSRYGANIFNGGVSGQGVETICARMGSHPAQIAFPGNTIPASGSVSVTSPNVDFYRFIDYFGEVAGVKGRIVRTTTADDPLTFTRTTPGAAVTLTAPAVFTPDEGISHRTSMSLLWMGKNDTLESADTATLIAKVVQYTDEAFDWLAPLNIRALVLGHFINRNTPSVSEVRNQINGINADYAERYGDLYIDVQGWLMSSQVWTDLGITPTSQDLADQAAGIIPESLARDNAHLTDAAYSGIVTYLIIPRIENVLGWFTSQE